MSRPSLSLVGLKPEERDLLIAMAEDRQTIDVGLAVCFLGKPWSATLAILDRLVRQGFLIARAGGSFSVSKDARDLLATLRKYRRWGR